MKSQRKRLLLVGIVLFLGLVGLVLLDRRPVHFSFLDGDLGAETEGGFEPRLGPSDVLLVVDKGEIAKAASEQKFSTMDWSLGWLNLLEQEVGRVALIDAGQLDDALKQPRRLVVVTRSCRARGDLANALSNFVKEGGVAAFEMPESSLARLCGLTTTSEPLEIDASQAQWSGKTPSDLLDGFKYPMAPVRVARVAADPGAEVLLAANQVPLVVDRPLGAGRLVSILMDIGRLVTANQQGRPTEDDYRMSEVLGDYPDIVEPDDLVGGLSALRENEVPHIDLIENAIYRLIAPSHQPVVSRIPPGSNGIFVLTHDEDFRGGPECEALLACSEKLGVYGSFLIIPHDRLADLWLEGKDWYQEISDRGGEIGFHLNRYQPMPVGFWKIEPLHVFYGTENQLDILRQHSPHVGPVTSNRNHYLVWGDHYTRMFRVFAAHGITIDSTYGANKGRGYLFGTGSAFVPLDTNGLPIPILEVPFLNQETWGGADLAFFERMLDANAQRFRGTFVSLFHPHLDFVDSDVDGMDGKALLTAILTKAKETGHTFMTLGQLDRFEQSRRQLEFTTRLSRDGMDIDVKNAAQGLALEIPAPPGDQLAINGQSMDPVARQDVGGPRWVIALPEGDCQITVRR